MRIGLHTGEPQVHEDDYIGIDVHRAARIMATAHGGQIVISQATHALVSEALPTELVLDLGWHRLKDLTEPEHLYEIVPPGSPSPTRRSAPWGWRRTFPCIPRSWWDGRRSCGPSRPRSRPREPVWSR